MVMTSNLKENNRNSWPRTLQFIRRHCLVHSFLSPCIPLDFTLPRPFVGGRECSGKESGPTIRPAPGLGISGLPSSGWGQLLYQWGVSLSISAGREGWFGHIANHDMLHAHWRDSSLTKSSRRAQREKPEARQFIGMGRTQRGL